MLSLHGRLKMKRNKMMTVLTILIAIVIIVVSVGVVNTYSYYRKQNNTSRTVHTKLSNASDVSFEKSFFDDSWEEYQIEGVECSNYPEEYANAYKSILKEFDVTTHGYECFRYKKDEFILLDRFDGGVIKNYLNQKDNIFEIKILCNGTEKTGGEKSGSKHIEEQLQKRNSKLYSMLNNVLYILQKNSIISKEQKNKFSSGSKFIHNQKIYIPFIAQENYILFIYDYRIEKYCGIKTVFSK